ncbi:MAG TPA: rRNA maturation RNase YbeY, partial [Terriglobales bacterium]
MALPFLLIAVIRMEDQSKEVSAATLSAFLRRAQRSVGLSGRVHVLITANEQMRKLNRRFRGKNKPTDVLSFPASAEVQSPESHAGDLAISLEIARANAKQLGHSVEDEIKVLLLHGVLHL